MINVLAVCDHAKHNVARDAFDSVLQINQDAPKRNLRLEIWNVSHWLLDTLKPVARDLLDIAAFVYYTDASVKRGTQNDVFEEDWARKFTFVIPVRNLEIWQRETVVAQLTEMLEYLTEDKFEFVFTKREDTPEQLVFKPISEQLPPSPEADCVSLFSGGMDSLAGAVYLQDMGRKPILVSHQSRPVLANLQHRLATPLRERFLSWKFPHLGVWINRKGPRATEDTQRSRSFLFAALGALVTYEMGLSDFFICENGITSLNLPRLGQTTGALATRSTHPQFLRLFHQLVAEVFGVDLRIEAPFAWKTRSDVIEIMKRNHCTDLLPLSSSCAHSRRPKIHPHCGICSQCVDRRFAVMYSGLDTPDELHGYERNIFTDALEGTEKMQAMSPVQFALDMRRRSLDSFCEKYVQVYDAIIDSAPGEGEQILKAIFDLHTRFANEVHEVIGREHGKNWDKVFNRQLPETCLLMLTSPDSSRRADALITERAEDLAQKLRECQVSESKPLEDICEEILTFLFCEDVPPTQALKKPDSQSKTDQGYKRRDLLFENRATEGYWAEAKREYDASGIVADAKNYKSEIGGDTVSEFSSKYLKEYGIGRLGIILARKVPAETRTAVTGNSRVPSAIEEQKNQWRDVPHKMIVLLGEDDIVQMLQMKASGIDPTELLRARIFTLRSRM